MIPKIIHYCWFGSNVPQYVQERVNAWKRVLPDYEFKLWNEDNYDLTQNIFLKNTVIAKQYAFTNDFFRADVLYNYGGIYMDIDMVILKSLDRFLNCESFVGLEHDGENRIGLGIMGSVKGTRLCKELRDYYNTQTFINKNLEFDFIPSTQIFSKLFYWNKNNEYNLTVYPSEVFYPMHIYSHELNITENSYAYHEWSYKDKKYWGHIKLTEVDKFKILKNLMEIRK